MIGSTTKISIRFKLCAGTLTLGLLSCTPNHPAEKISDCSKNKFPKGSEVSIIDTNTLRSKEKRIADDIGISRDTMKSTIAESLEKKAVAVAFIATGENTTASDGSICLDVFEVSKEAQVGEPKLVKRVVIDGIKTRTGFVTAVPIPDPLNNEERTDLRLRHKDAWLRLETKIDDDDGKHINQDNN